MRSFRIAGFPTKKRFEDMIMDDLPQDGREAIPALKELDFLKSVEMSFSLAILGQERLIWQSLYQNRIGVRGQIRIGGYNADCGICRYECRNCMRITDVRCLEKIPGNCTARVAES
jgi:hypothetical protein